MKIKRIFSLMTAGLAMCGVMSSCSQDEPFNGTQNGDGELSLYKSPKVLAYSGNHTWGSTIGGRGANMNANMWGQDWDCIPNAELTPEELAELKELLSPRHEVENDIIFPFENYWVQQVYKGESTYNTHDRCEQPDCDHVNGETVLGSDKMNHLMAWDGSQQVYWPEPGVGDYVHINNFNFGTNTNEVYDSFAEMTHKGTTLMVDMSTDGVTATTQFGYDETYGTDPKFYNNYIMVFYKGYWYVGFDYEAHKNDQTTHNHGEGMDVERDWCFTDWIVRITPAYHKGMTPETPWQPEGQEQPEQPGEQPEQPGQDLVLCPSCGHLHMPGAECNECEGGVCHEGNNPGVDTPATPGHRTGMNEVEANLTLEDGVNDHASHLSLHVRHATDVEVFIPVPATYYVDADDMAIVQQHFENLTAHGGPTRTEFDINGHIVSLNIEFQEGGIRIWTEGINQEVIDYCYERFGDGITFEVWNYFNDAISREDLKYLLNKATIEFLDSLPDAYINAFNELGGTKNPDDCNVDIVENQVNEFNDAREGEHLNGSHYNQIYDNKNPSGETEEN